MRGPEVGAEASPVRLGSRSCPQSAACVVPSASVSCQYVEYLREVKRWVEAEERAVLVALKKREDDRVGGWLAPHPPPHFRSPPTAAVGSAGPG
jgi:hypothetical protein